MCLQFILFYLHVPFEVSAARVRCECTVEGVCTEVSKSLHGHTGS